MKNNTIHFILICIAFFSIGLLLSTNYYLNKRISTMNDSINRLIIIEVITEKQFNLLVDKIQRIEQMTNRFSQND